MKLYPDEARGYLRRIAYIPVGNRQRDYILENSTVIHPPWHYILFHNIPQRLDKIKKPVFQVNETTNRPRIKADTFNRPIHVASFDALWHPKVDPVFGKQVAGESVDTPKSPDGLNTHGGKTAQKTNWWKTAYHMLRLKCRLKTYTYVACHDFSLEFLDNPAIAALVAYKW